MNRYNIPEVSEEEFNQTADEFRKASYFAAIKVGGKCINDFLVRSLRNLHDLNLLPIVVHGGGDQIDQKLAEAGILINKINGKRVTDKPTLDIVVATLKGVNKELVNNINESRDYADDLNGIFFVDGIDPVYGHVGKVVGIEREAIDYCIMQKKMPIISCLGRYKQEYSNINGDTAFAFLVSQIKPLKIIALTPEGGVYKGKDLKELVSEMTLPELDEFIAGGYADGGMGLKLEELRKLVRLGFDVQITSSEMLMIELFSRKGHGTYLHKAA